MPLPVMNTELLSIGPKRVPSAQPTRLSRRILKSVMRVRNVFIFSPLAIMLYGIAECLKKLK